MPFNETTNTGKVFVPPNKISKKYNRTCLTLRRWAEQGRVDHIITHTGRYLYNIYQVEQMLGQEGEEERKKICYARVSSAKQKEDLQRQVQDLKAKLPDHEIIQEVGSGVNFQRKGFKRLLDLVCQGLVSEVVIMHKDRLCRFGYDLLEHIFQQFHTKLLVYSQEEDNEWQSPEEELSQDLLAIINVFTARNNGRRAVKNKKRRARENTSSSQEKNQNVVQNRKGKQREGREGLENTSVSNQEREGEAESMDGHIQVDL